MRRAESKLVLYEKFTDIKRHNDILYNELCFVVFVQQDQQQTTPYNVLYYFIVIRLRINAQVSLIFPRYYTHVRMNGIVN